ncbi:hypothetical protein [Bradyrhizobium sp. Cp5.3]|uniref:hypothetical protein n=1 Tax=Bradyrhizobium sp. Cp5.3 TaxID=443598 RepID=UPI0003F8FCB6|nr:hypothetical protein [Bradyrhizobium sp. Cp5.3]
MTARVVTAINPPRIRRTHATTAIAGSIAAFKPNRIAIFDSRQKVLRARDGERWRR